VSFAVNVYVWLIVIRAFLSWVRPNPNSTFMRILSGLTDPALVFARRAFPLRLGGLDFSPIVLILLLTLAGSLVSGGLTLLAQGRPLSLLLPLLAFQILSMIQSIIFLIGIIMLIRLILSLVKPDMYNPAVMFIYGLTEPLLAPLRRWFPRWPRGLDVKALIFIVGLIVAYLLIQLLALALLPQLGPRP
jgi:YggT family protein